MEGYRVTENLMGVELRNFVGGEWVDAADGGVMEVLNPATEESIATVPRGSAADVEGAVAAAKEAFPAWRDRTPAERAAALFRLADLIDENAEELAALESRNVGKPQMVSAEEIPLCSDSLR